MGGEGGFKQLLENKFSSPQKIIQSSPMALKIIPMPYSKTDLETIKNRYIYYESSRGCIYRCSYCLSSRNDHRLELRDFEMVKKEISVIMEYNPQVIKFVDRTFNAVKSHYNQIWNFLIDSFGDQKTIFHFEIHPALLTDDDFKLLERCPEHLFQFEIGIQTTNDNTLKEIGRIQPWEKVKLNIEQLIAMKKFHIHLDLIIGLPFEDIESCKDSFNKVYSLGSNHVQVGFLKVLPGTVMSEKENEYKIKKENRAPYSVISTKWLSQNDIILFHTIANLVDLFYSRSGFSQTLFEMNELFNEPFHLYEALGNHTFLYNKKLNRTWETGSEFILSFIESSFPAKFKYFLDCLRWDWCSLFRSHYYPKILQSESLKRTKKDALNILQSSETAHLKIGLNHKSALKRVLFFEPEDENYKKKHLPPNSIIAFIPELKKSYIVK